MINKSRHETSLLIVSNAQHDSNWVEGVIKTYLKAFLENVLTNRVANLISDGHRTKMERCGYLPGARPRCIVLTNPLAYFASNLPETLTSSNVYFTSDSRFKNAAVVFTCEDFTKCIKTQVKHVSRTKEKISPIVYDDYKIIVDLNFEDVEWVVYDISERLDSCEKLN